MRGWRSCRRRSSRRSTSAALVDRVVTLENAHHIRVAGGPRLTVQGDSDQLEQLLINLMRNALDAARETGGGVTVGWQRLPYATPPSVELWVEDEGPGSRTPATCSSPSSRRSREGPGSASS
jgi:two-component system, NtrC family, nitrogen regulation sensor histidine kinase NtrY